MMRANITHLFYIVLALTLYIYFIFILIGRYSIDTIYIVCDITTMHAFISIPSNFCSRCIRRSSQGNYAFFIDPHDSANRISPSLTSDMCDSAFVYSIDAHVFFVSFHRYILESIPDDVFQFTS